MGGDFLLSLSYTFIYTFIHKEEQNSQPFAPAGIARSETLGLLPYYLRLGEHG